MESSQAAESDNAELKDAASDTEEGSDASAIAVDMANTNGPTPIGFMRRYTQTMEEAQVWRRPAQVALPRKLKHENARVALERQAATTAASQSTVRRCAVSAASAASQAGVGAHGAWPAAWGELRGASRATPLLGGDGHGRFSYSLPVLRLVHDPLHTSSCFIFRLVIRVRNNYSDLYRHLPWNWTAVGLY